MIVFIDGSYFVFYRYHALLAWWKLRHPETYTTVLAAPIDNPEFVAQFCKLTTQSISNIVQCCSKILGGTPVDTVFIAKDCPRNDIWRMKLYENYKGTRGHNAAIAPFFELFYQQKVNAKIISHPQLEADDCIALMCRCQQSQFEKDMPMFIIGSDNDYLQLLQIKNVYITDLSHMTSKMMSIKRAFTEEEKTKLIRASAHIYNGLELMKKILGGDKSDNIMPVFNAKEMRQLGLLHKTNDIVAFFIDHPDQLMEDLTRMNKLQEYNLNQQLIDFSFIPISHSLLTLTLT